VPAAALPNTADAPRREAELRARVFAGLASPNRVALAVELAKGATRVKDLARSTGLTQANASHQLGAMWNSGLVARERRGVAVHYRLVNGVTELLSAADEMLERAGTTNGASPRPGRRASRP